jgi:hypothetical protein
VVKIKRITVKVLPGKKDCKIPSQLMAAHSGIHLSSPTMQGRTDRRIMVQDIPGVKLDPVSKIS